MKSTIEIKATPGAKTTEIVGYEGKYLKIRIHAVQEKGKANEELISFLSNLLKLPKKNFSITHGKTQRIKRIVIEGIDEESLSKKLLGLF